jgi:hypothetical protein
MALRELNVFVAMKHQLLPVSLPTLIEWTIRAFPLMAGFGELKDFIYTLERQAAMQAITACSLSSHEEEKKWV